MKIQLLLALLLTGYVLAPLASAEELPDTIEKKSRAVVAISWEEPNPSMTVYGLSKGSGVVFKGRKEDVERAKGQFEKLSTVRESTTAFANGTLVSADGLIIAPGPSTLPNHVRQIRVTLPNQETFDARRLVVDGRHELSLLTIDSEAELEFVAPSAADADVGESLFSIHRAPDGMQTVAAVGILAAKNRSVAPTLQGALQTDLQTGPGSSGSPVFNLQGNLVGIVVAAKGKEGAGISFAIPAKHVEQLMESVPKSDESVVTLERGYLGVALALKDGDVVVRSVLPGTGAAKAGVQPDDAILSIEDKKVATIEETVSAVGELGADREIRVRIRRGDREYDLPVTLSKREQRYTNLVVKQVVPSELVVPTPNNTTFTLRALQVPENRVQPPTIRVQRAGLDQRVDDLEKELKRLTSKIDKLTEMMSRFEESLDE